MNTASLAGEAAFPACCWGWPKGLVWPGLVWLGLAWLGLAWLGLA
tara:strand:+ start:335 stop:469 length:135 start_codon:yes stop_codon:yes gene_type:complete